MTTPARRQYLDIKAQHQDAILLYQVGDFFETFDEDARIASRELQIVLTARTYGPDELVPLAGVPVHALDTYTAKLVARGYRVAICEQTSPPGRGLVRREVTRILTPGTVVEPNMMVATHDNYLAAIALGKRDAAKGSYAGAGLAYIDASSGTFSCTQWSAAQLPDALNAELHRLAPAEVLTVERPATIKDIPSDEPYSLGDITRTPCPAHYFDADSARVRLCRHFDTPTLAAFGCEGQPLAIAAAGAILAYLERMNPALLRLLTDLHTYDTRGFVEIDGRTWRALEVTESSRPLAPAGSTAHAPTLLDTLDAARTHMGARLLRRTLLQPICDRLALEQRLDAVAEIQASLALREQLGMTLEGLGDLERLTGRIVQGSAIPRELHALAATLARVPALMQALQAAAAPALIALHNALDPCTEAQDLIARAIADPAEPGASMIRRGYSADLDAMVGSISNARAWIANLEATERERTGIKSLKVGYNKVFGYYLDVSRANLARVPPDYQRRQTLTNGERFVTAELKEHEALVLHAEEQIAELERTLYNEVLGMLAVHQARLRATAQAIAQIDVWLALAEVAVARNYVRPELTDSTEMEIVEGRHPIVETTLDGGEFIPNDTRLGALTPDSAEPRIMLLTGPNMAGKSTYLRQVASIVLLAQIGSFVPATRARIGLVDRIFTRVGAEDDLARGLSTFMLEMVETAYILRHATARSLIVLDEVGRGTSTHDGLAIARAVIEYLHDTIGARTLFATHYRELSALADELPRLRVFRMAVAEQEGEAIFLHRIVPGASDHSYGVQVARMAGLPAQVTSRATELLAASEQGIPQQIIAERRELYASEAPPLHGDDDALDVDAAEHRELALALASVNIAAMTPLEALNLLFSLQQRALLTLRQR